MAAVRGDNPTARWGPRDPALNYMETSVTATLTLSRAKPVTHGYLVALPYLGLTLPVSFNFLCRTSSSSFSFSPSY